jgi:hypothetical protein
VDLCERSRSSRRSLTLGKPDGVVDVGSGSGDAVAREGGACDSVGSGGTGDMVWKYGIADDVDDIAIYIYILADECLLVDDCISLRIDVGMVQPQNPGSWTAFHVISETLTYCSVQRHE